MTNGNNTGSDNSITGTVKIEQDPQDKLATTVTVSGGAADVIRQAAGGPTVVKLDRSSTDPTPDQPLWVAIRNRTKAIEFDRYSAFINAVLCEREDSPRDEFGSPSLEQRRTDLEGRDTIHGVDAYKLLKLATEAFMIFECGVAIENGDLFDAGTESRRLDREVTFESICRELSTYLGGDSGVLPYLDRIVDKIVGFRGGLREECLPFCEAMLQKRLTCPSLIELIWCYWHEEGMLAQTLNVIAMRFQNKRRGANDPLANLELDALRPLSNLLWGFIQDEPNRLTLKRRAYEYDHHYGFRLVGKAIENFQPADSRAKFVEAFHTLLYRTMMFYREDDDTTVVADAFAMLNALREVHIILAEGAHNQYGDLPWTARREMLTMQWLLARSEVREFIRGRYMVPYQERWMGAVDDMKRLQGWSDVTITHFHELAIYGEQVLLSVRFGDWIDINEQDLAKNWARYWRPEIQRYIHAYHAITGVDLSADISDVRVASDRYEQPSILISNRLAQNKQARLPRPSAGKLRAPADDQEDVLDRPATSRRSLPKHV